MGQTGPPSGTGERPAGPVAPERFAVLQSLLAYLLAACGDDREATIPARDVIERFMIPEEERGWPEPVPRLERNPELVALAKRLHRQKPKGGRMSLRAISAELAAQGFLNDNGRPFAAASTKSMLHS